MKYTMFGSLGLLQEVALAFWPYKKDESLNHFTKC